MLITFHSGFLVIKLLRLLLVNENYKILNEKMVNFKALTSLVRVPVQTSTDYVWITIFLLVLLVFQTQTILFGYTTAIYKIVLNVA